MMKFNLTESKDNFIIDFDVPVIADAVEERDFSSFLNILTDKNRFSIVCNGADEIIRIQGKLKSLLDITDEFLPEKSAATQKEILNYLLKNGSKTQSNGLQVNFHQNSFDTSFRYWKFIIEQGHFVDYFFNRLNWYIAPKDGYVTPFPLHVDIESASTCNMNCPMCYRDQLKESGQMDYHLFKKAVDECAANNVFSIRLSWRGETLTHPRIKEMIAYAKSRIKNVSFLTNAFYLDNEMIDCFIENKVNYIAVSFDGIGKTYEAIRHPATFEENYKRLALLKKRKEVLNSKLPKVRLCTIWPAIKDDPDSYYQTMKEVSDYIVCNPYINFKGSMKIKPDFICQYPWERIVIGYDGNAQCCTGWNANDIILGNIKDQSITQMWHSNKMKKIRKLHTKGLRMQLKSCAVCRHGSESDPEIDIKDIIERRH